MCGQLLFMGNTSGSNADSVCGNSMAFDLNRAEQKKGGVCVTGRGGGGVRVLLPSFGPEFSSPCEDMNGPRCLCSCSVPL